jgi:hypothetical protein
VSIVTGGPGTGKTAVALHRAAYLLYSDRSRFAGGGVLVVGPSGVFVEYIATVLPSLGEDTATLRSLGTLVAGWDAARVDSTDVAAIKGSLRMRRVLERASHDAVPGAPAELRLLYRGALLRLQANELDRIRRSALPRGARRNEVRGHGFDRIFDALWAQARSQQVRNLPEKRDFEAELSDRGDFRDFLRAWWPRLTPLRVLRWMADPGRLRAYANGVLSREEIATLQGAFDGLETDGPTIADVALLDELDEILGRPRQPAKKNRNPFHVRDGVQEVSTYADRQAAARKVTPRDDDYRDYAHVVVDEAQDVSPMQWRMIGRRGQYASWTIVGDPAQTAWSGDPEELDRARDRALGTRRRNTYALTTNYRNSSEIFAVAASVIRTIMPDLPLPSAVRSTGVDPVDVVVDAAMLPAVLRDAVEKQLADVDGTVGVITPVPRRDEVAGWLGGVAGERLQVVTALEAKGMEYDAVVLVEPGDLTKDASGIRTLYVALSRATQRLTTLGTDPDWHP